MVPWRTRCRWHTGYSADSAEWCPVEPYQDVMVCGTYQLDQNTENDPETKSKKQTRLGRIYLFDIKEDTKELVAIQTVDTSGILDQKWCYHTIQDYPVLAVATSIGTIQLYRLTNENEVLKLKLWLDYLIGEDILALSLDWSTNKTVSNDPLIVVSDSSGTVTLLKVAEDVVEIGKWKTHGFEAWIAAFNYWNTDVFYSGGDDCVFKSYDVRAGGAVASSRAHDAGVTAVRSHIDIEHCLLTGSYDEKIRIWDSRNLKSCVSDLSVGGGVWRLKWHPQKPNTLVAACMYGGFRLLKDDDVVAEYMEHESIAYGADWSHKNGLLATCSFYDCSLHISEVNV